MGKEIPKNYDPKIEEDLYKSWEDRELFKARNNSKKESFVIPIPPPNVTSHLHLGHAAMLALEDIMIRYKKMKGFESLWIPGTDHAAIATHNVVERQIAKEGKKISDYTRDEFVKKCWEWSEKTHDTITNQIKKMGSALDFSREKFTMSPEFEDIKLKHEVEKKIAPKISKYGKGMNEAVKTVFKRMYEDGLIYRGERMVNWCPRCESTLSDEEVDHKDEKGKLYHISYPLYDNPETSITVATTRPETLLGDTAIAVNPKDKRFKDFVGKKVFLPVEIPERKEFEFGKEDKGKIIKGPKIAIPVIADSYVDMKFGTGVLKITPLHDPNDFEVAIRNKLKMVRAINQKGEIFTNFGKYGKLSRENARKEIVKDLEENGLLLKIEDHDHSVGKCYRCHTSIEPFSSKQWFVDTDHKNFSLKKAAIEAVKSNKVKIIPKRFEKIYFHWTNNLRDWCISRQIYWGHRLPVWFDEQENIYLPKRQNLFFIRHGESEGNIESKIGGDPKLTRKGEEDAKKLGKSIKSKKITKIISSPRIRAKKTAELIGKELGVEKIEIWDDLKEMYFGKHDGEYFDYELNKNPWKLIPDKELKELEERAKNIWEKLEKETQENILIVSHGGFLGILFATKENLNSKQFVDFRDSWSLDNLEIKKVSNLKEPEGKNLNQSDDTLDTWFSSALWPFSTLGWPNDTENLKKFYPNSVLETGYDILFFWVLKMIMVGKYATGKYPFHTVYLHGLVCDEKGKKMSKSLGNGINPLEMIEKFGADPVRLSLVVGTSPGNNMNLSENKIAGYRNYVNKIWNASRFAMIKISEQGKEGKENIIEIKDKDEIEQVKQFFQKEMYDIVNLPREKSEIDLVCPNGIRDYYFAKRKGKEILGAIQIHTCKSNKPFQIARIAVSPKHRGKNIARELLEKTFDIAIEKGAKNIYLDSRENVVKMYEKFGFKIKGKKFIWHDGNPRFSMVRTIEKEDPEAKNFVDKWIISRLNTVIKNTEKNLDNYQFSHAGEEIYAFFWRDFCDVYLEFQKKFPNLELLKFVLENSLKLLHPFIPFVTDAIWKNLGYKNSILEEEFPKYEKKFVSNKLEKDFSEILKTSSKIRDLRSRNEFPKRDDSYFYSEFISQDFEDEILAYLLGVESKNKKGNEILREKLDFGEICFFGENFEKKKNSEKISQEINDLKSSIKKREKLLSNKNFVKNAPQKVVDLEKDKLEKDKKKLEILLNS